MCLQVGSLLGGLVARGTLSLCQVKARVTAVATAATGCGPDRPSAAACRHAVLKGTIGAMAERTQRGDLRQQLMAAGLLSEFAMPQVRPD